MKRIIPILLLVLLPTAAVAQVPDLSTLLPQGEGSARRPNHPDGRRC